MSGFVFVCVLRRNQRKLGALQCLLLQFGQILKQTKLLPPVRRAPLPGWEWVWMHTQWALLGPEYDRAQTSPGLKNDTMSLTVTAATEAAEGVVFGQRDDAVFSLQPSHSNNLNYKIALAARSNLAPAFNGGSEHSSRHANSERIYESWRPGKENAIPNPERRRQAGLTNLSA